MNQANRRYWDAAAPDWKKLPKDSHFWEGISYKPGENICLANWSHNPRAGRPAWLTIAAQK